MSQDKCKACEKKDLELVKLNAHIEFHEDVTKQLHERHVFVCELAERLEARIKELETSNANVKEAQPLTAEQAMEGQ